MLHVSVSTDLMNSFQVEFLIVDIVTSFAEIITLCILPFVNLSMDHSPFPPQPKPCSLFVSLVCFYFGNSFLLEVLLFSNNSSFPWIGIDVFSYFVCEFISKGFCVYLLPTASQGSFLMTLI